MKLKYSAKMNPSTLNVLNNALKNGRSLWQGLSALERSYGRTEDSVYSAQPCFEAHHRLGSTMEG